MKLNSIFIAFYLLLWTKIESGECCEWNSCKTRIGNKNITSRKKSHKYHKKTEKEKEKKDKIIDDIGGSKENISKTNDKNFKIINQDENQKLFDKNFKIINQDENQKLLAKKGNKGGGNLNTIITYFSNKNIALKIEDKKYTQNEFKQLISEKLYIPKRRIKLLFDNKELGNDNEIINDIEYEKFDLYIDENATTEDIVDIKLIDHRWEHEEERNIRKIDLYGDIPKQIYKYMDIDTNSNDEPYLVYKNTFSDYEYKIYADRQLGEEIKLDLYEAKGKNKIEIKVKTATGLTINLRVDPNEHVGHLKGRIYKEQGFPVVCQNLLFAGTLLKDNETLQNYNITKQATLHLNFKFAGNLKSAKTVMH